jgi:hypothetical protein
MSWYVVYAINLQTKQTGLPDFTKKRYSLDQGDLAMTSTDGVDEVNVQLFSSLTTAVLLYSTLNHRSIIRCQHF